MKRRDIAKVDYSCDIDEFIRFAQRWSRLHERLLNTLARLPEEVYQFAKQKISFHAGQSQTIQAKEINKTYLIILKRTDSESLIAHEIAHAYLNYAKASVRLEDQESQADELRKKWGFKKNSFARPFLRVALTVLIHIAQKAKPKNPTNRIKKQTCGTTKNEIRIPSKVLA